MHGVEIQHAQSMLFGFHWSQGLKMCIVAFRLDIASAVSLSNLCCVHLLGFKKLVPPCVPHRAPSIWSAGLPSIFSWHRLVRVQFL